MNIVFEGIDGTGKTTLIKAFLDDLKRKGELVRYIDELTENSPISEVLNKMLSDDPFFNIKTSFPTSIFESLLLAADLHYRQAKYKYDDGYNLYDRDFLSILAYQKEILKEDYNNYLEFYKAFKTIVEFNLKPIDFMVYVYAPIETSIARIIERDGIVYDEEQTEFLKSLKQNFEQELIPEIERKKVKVLKLDGRRNPKYNVAQIYKEINYETD